MPWRYGQRLEVYLRRVKNTLPVCELFVNERSKSIVKNSKGEVNLFAPERSKYRLNNDKLGKGRSGNVSKSSRAVHHPKVRISARLTESTTMALENHNYAEPHGQLNQKILDLNPNLTD